ncbi:MAG: HD domain-containing protein [Chloroflexi bacterium]|nr:HD domain-containing protein [Chloroflexota bacterium]
MVQGIDIEQARHYYSDDDPVHDFDHVLRVTALAVSLAQHEGADLDVVRTAALLHDIVRTADPNHVSGFALQSDGETDHAVLAGRRTREILQGADPAFVEAVVHAIEAHRFRNAIDPQTIEAQCLFDADKLDAIGAVGVARAFAYAGLHRMPLWGEVSKDYRPGESDEAHTPHHEFVVKLQTIKDRLYTASARRMAAERHAFMVRFFEQMGREIRAPQSPLSSSNTA